MMKRKILKIGIIVLLAGLLCGVYYCFFHVPKYVGEYQIDDEVIAEFYEHREEYQQVADIVRHNTAFWEYFQLERDTGHAGIHNPYWREEMKYFSKDEQDMIVDFFETFRPSWISINYQNDLRITYGNAEGYPFYIAYYYTDVTDRKQFLDSEGKAFSKGWGEWTLEEWIDYYLSFTDYYIDLGENWYFFGNN
jgi:hypothetical protein